MDQFRFVPPALMTMAMVAAMPSPQDAPTPADTRRLPSPGPPGGAAPAPRFLPGLFGPPPQTNPNHQVQNTLAAGGVGAIAGVAGLNCLFGKDCDLSFRPSLGAAVDANGQIKPQLGLTTQVGNGANGIGTTFTGGLQLDQNSQNGIGTFVGAGINNGNANGISPGIQTGFGFSQGANGQTQATSQLGGSIQAPQVAGVNFGRPNTPLGLQPTLFGSPVNGPQPHPSQNPNPFGAFFGGLGRR